MRSRELEGISSHQREKYRTFCAAQPEIPLFFQDWYLDAVCADGTWDAAILENPHGEVQSVWPFFLKRKWGFQYITMPHFVKYMGPWPTKTFSPEYSGSIHEIARLLPRVDALRQNFHYSFLGSASLSESAYHARQHHTYLLDIGDLDAVFSGINRNMRRNILKAQREVRVFPDNDPERFFPISEAPFKRKGMPTPYPKSLFFSHDAALGQHAQRQIFFAVDTQGRTHAAAYLIWDKRSAYYHLSGDDPGLRQSGAGILLIWEAIRFAKEELGLGVFDFEGSMLPAVEAIRRQFGARQTTYPYVWQYPNPLLRWLFRTENR